MALDDAVSWAIGLKAMAAPALGQFEKGVKFAERNVALFPGNADVRAFFSLTLFLSSRHHEAIETMRAAIDLNPKHPVWYLGGLARSLAAIGKSDEAMVLADRLISRDSNYFQAYLIKALVLVAAGRKEEAQKKFARFARSPRNFGRSICGP